MAPPTGRSVARRPLGRSVADRPPWLVITQLFFGLGWLRAAGAKVISIDWWTGDAICSFVADHADTTLPWIEPVTDAVVAVAPLIAVLVLDLQAGTGLALIVDRGVPAALAAATLLNVTFVAIGAVNPSAFYLVGQGAIALWLVGRRPPTARVSRALRLTTGAAVAAAAVSAPFITTVDPALVIEDPAIVIVMLGALTALACQLTHRAMFGRGLP